RPCDVVSPSRLGAPASTTIHWKNRLLPSSDGALGISSGACAVPFGCATAMRVASGEASTRQPPPRSNGSGVVPETVRDSPPASTASALPGAWFSVNAKLVEPSAPVPLLPSAGTRPPVPAQPVP